MNKTADAYRFVYQGEQALCLTWEPYEAVVLPGVGGNLIAFRDTVQQYQFLHEPSPEEMDIFREKPTIYGIPVLFPPNRYDAGKFTLNEKLYEFPVNEAQTGNHLHGFLYDIPWKVIDYGTTKLTSFVTMEQKVHPKHSVYSYFPHSFTIQLTYSLNQFGLLQHVSVRNDGDDPMPCMLAFHTAINAPFSANSTPADYEFTTTIDRRWELDNRMLPTGLFQPLSAVETKLKTTGISPYCEPMDNHYTASMQNGRNRMELIDKQNHVKLIYDVGSAYQQWMIWNNNATPGFFCAEPQINVVNAPNLDLPADQIGLVTLQPGEIWEETSRLYVLPWQSSDSER